MVTLLLQLLVPLLLIVMLLVDFVEGDYFDLALDSGSTLKVN